MAHLRGGVSPIGRAGRSGVATATLTWLASVLVALGSAEEVGSQERPPGNLPDLPWLEWVREIEVAESEAVVNVTPVVRADPRGGFLVADPSEAQIRRYLDDGSLQWHVGRRGGGPLEFRAPQVALRLASGEVFVADRDARFITLDSAGTTLAREYRTDMLRVVDAAEVDDTLLVIAAAYGQDPVRETGGPRLHLFDVENDRVVSSFFRPFDDVRRNVAATAGFTLVSTFENRIAAAALPIDSLFIYDEHGILLDRFELPTENFRVMQPIPPREFRDPEQRVAWLSSFETVTQVHWMSRRAILVQYRTLEGTTPRWNLLGTTPSGERLFEWRDSPRLLGVDPKAGLLVFQSPTSPTADKWLIGRLVR